MTKDILGTVDNSQAFFLSDGRRLLSLKDLMDALKTMDSNMFSSFVNEQKNDFEKWVKNVIGDETLADSIKDLRKEDLMFKAVYDRIKELEKVKKPKKIKFKLKVKNDLKKTETKNDTLKKLDKKPEVKRDYRDSIIDFALGVAVGFALGLLVKLLA